jgi:aminopeptidase YwaD
MRHVDLARLGAPLLCCALLAGAAFGGEAPVGAVEPAATGGPEIRVEDLRAHVQVLASDAYAGRMSTEEGGRLAAEYVAASFRRSGLAPKGVGGTWFQPFVVPLPVLGEGNRLVVRLGETRRTCDLGLQWNPVSVTASGEVDADLVFAGFGIAAKDARDDYAGLDVKGKVVLVLRRAPTRELLRHAPLLAKLNAAAERGAAALLVVNDAGTVKEEGDALLPWNAHIGAAAGSAKIPFAFVSRDLAKDLLGHGGLDLGAAEAEARKSPASRALPGVGVHLKTAISETKEANARNVVGFLTGRDPEVADEVVVIGAHHDHVGLGGASSLAGPKGQGQVHNGADDNASGTALLLELAEWFAREQNRPRRSLLFLSFSGEELGLLGSIHYVNEPLVPLEDTVTMVNLDMVGRCTKNNLEVGGVGTGTRLQEIVAAANRTHAFEIRWDAQGQAPTDSTSFFLAKVPVLWFFTGMHEDYHRPGDDADKVCYDDLARITRLTGDVVRTIAEQDARVVYTDPPKQRRRARLGVQPAQEPHARGVALQSVLADGPAARAGLQAGDVLLTVGGQTVRTAQDLQEVMRKLEPGKPVAVVVLRDGAEVTVTITLGE